MFLPTTTRELRDLGWTAEGEPALDILLITGDAYIDSPFIGVALIGKVLLDAGFRVGIIAQPDTTSGEDITRLDEPRLFWGVSGGCIDSMVANRTASGKRRRSDDYTPGGVNDRRPDRAVIAYSNLIRQHFKRTRPIVLGGIEASLRRVAHYDCWSDRIRRSVLFDAKADYLLHGMAERSVVELAHCLDGGGDPRAIRGLCYTAAEPPAGAELLPSFEDVRDDRDAFTRMFHGFYDNNDPITAKPLAQQQDTRFLVQNPPAAYLSTAELDAVHDLPFERELHPHHRARGEVRALETIRCSITTHRGCYGECHFCAITVHQGRTVRWRSQRSIVAEARAIAAHPRFKGTIQDVGGPTANMYGFECKKKLRQGSCPDKRCLFPEICESLKIDLGKQLALLEALRRLPGIKRVFVASGIRHDMLLAAGKQGDRYLRTLVQHHVSGQLKIAPEHSEARVLQAMGKGGGREALLEFRERFERLNREAGKKQFLTYYLIAAHPGCTQGDMQRLAEFSRRALKVRPEQVQIFTPTPSTYSTLMYWTGEDPFTGEPCFVERGARGRQRQKDALTGGKR